MGQFAETIVNFTDGQTNVQEPPEAILLAGFQPQTQGSRGSPLPAQWLNWLFRELFRLVGLDVATQGTNAGTGLFRFPNSFIELRAIDRDNPNLYLAAMGHKGAGDTMHVLKVISSNGLTLGTPTLNGDQPILGGVDVIVTGYSRKYGA